MKYILILAVIMIFSTFTYAFFSKSKVSLDGKPKDIYDYAVNLIDGKQQKESYVVWRPDQIITSNNTYSCISENKLYVINH